MKEVVNSKPITADYGALPAELLAHMTGLLYDLYYTMAAVILLSRSTPVVTTSNSTMYQFP